MAKSKDRSKVVGGTVCACDSGRAFDVCCGPYLSGAVVVPTAVALMRSRYTAFARDDQAYIQASWHPDTRPDAPATDVAPEGGHPRCHWLGLQVISEKEVTGQNGHAEADQGTVEFIARYKIGGRAGRIHEVSRFVRVAGKWVYVDGIFPMGTEN